MVINTLREALDHYDDIKPDQHEALRLSPNEVENRESPEGEEYELKDDLLIALKSGRILTDDLTEKDIEYMLSLPEISEYNRQNFLLIDDAIGSIAECSSRNYFPVLRCMFKGTDFSALMPCLYIHGTMKKTGKFTPEFLHGFMFGMALTPSLIMPDEWHPYLFGDECKANELLKSYGVQPSASGRKDIWDQCRLRLPDAIEILIKYAQPTSKKLPPQIPVQSNKVARNAPGLFRLY